MISQDLLIDLIITNKTYIFITIIITSVTFTVYIRNGTDVFKKLFSHAKNICLSNKKRKREISMFISELAEKKIKADYKNHKKKSQKKNTKKNKLDEKDFFFKANNKFIFEDYKKAIYKFDAAIEIKPDYSDAFFNKGLCYFELKKYKKAIDDINKAIELKSDEKSYRIIRGCIYFILRKYSNSVDDILLIFQDKEIIKMLKK